LTCANKILALACCILASTALAAQAGVQNEVPSCYAANQIEPADHLGYSRLIYVLVDQTVGWNADIKQSILDNLNVNLTPGTKFVIAKFSVFSQGRYLDVADTGIIENPLPVQQFDNTPIEKSKIFNACLAGQRPYAIALADRGLLAILQNSTSSLNHSDIMSALQAVSIAISADPAPNKLLLLASDGLENSGVTSFYHHGNIRDIGPGAELRRASAAGLFGNFSGARVFVIGGALAGPTASSAYRSPQTLEHLADFWRLYFQKSNAQLIEFGEPALLEQVRF
jgi:hypothetical protein